AARAGWAVVVWILVLAAWGALRTGTRSQRIGRALTGPVTLLVLGVAAVLLPRPVPRLTTTDSDATIIDYHAHTQASHDGRPGWTLAKLAAWHGRRGFEARSGPDPNVGYDGSLTPHPAPA